MIKLFLKAKHWQLFTIFFALPLILQFVVMGDIMSIMPFDADSNQDPTELFDSLVKVYTWMPIVFLPALFGYTAWFWSISVGFYPKLPDHHKLNLVLFKWMVIASAVLIMYMLYVFSTNIPKIFDSIVTEQSLANLETLIWPLLMMIPIGLIGFVCMMYAIYHTAKTIKLMELGDSDKKSEIIGEFVLLWFYYIGVWILQPKINKMISDDFESPKRETMDDKKSLYDN
jgi:hypothetical protein